MNVLGFRRAVGVQGKGVRMVEAGWYQRAAVT